MFIVGLTGGIGSGKSSVSDILRNNGVTVLDMDEYARVVVRKGQPALRKIVKHFGKDILLPDGTLDRAKLGKIIFADEVQRKKLNCIVHPAIYRHFFWDVLLNFLKGHSFVVVDVPLLYESRNLVGYLSCVVVVWCPREQQSHRLKGRNDWSDQEIENRISCQIPLDDKLPLADHVIMNDGPIEYLEPQVKHLLKLLRNSKSHWKIRFFILTAISAVSLLSCASLTLLKRLYFSL